jgi:methionyl aminopeptidase
VILVKSPQELARMERANTIVREVLALLEEAVEPGVSTEDLDRLAETEIRKRGGTTAFKGYHGYPKTLCASVNDEVVHGIPHRKRKLAEGDIIGLDLGAVYEGYYGDGAVTVGVGRISEDARLLIEATREALHVGIAKAVPGAPLHEIGRAIQQYAEGRGYSIVRDYVGHGIGTSLHEEPQVPNYWPGRPGPALREGMVLAIEPMLNIGTARTSVDADGWTVRTYDGKLSAHFELSVAVTADGPRILGTPVQTAAA